MSLSQILLVPGIGQPPLQELQSLLFAGGQRGGMWLPSLTGLSGLFTDTAGTTVATTFGQGVGRVADSSSSANVATQATGASKASTARHPTGGRRNLLTQTEAFTTSGWSTSVVGTGVIPVITLNHGVAPDGTTTAARMQFDTGAGATGGDRSTLTIGVGNLSYVAHTSSCYIKPLDGTTAVQLATYQFVSAAIAGGAATNDVVTDVGDGWFFVTRRTTPAAPGNTFRFELRGNNAATLDALIWHPQCEVGTVATDYQKVTTTHDVTETGKADVWHLSFDGTDDFLQTSAIDFSNSDKMTVFALVRKSSDAARGMVAELSASWQAGNGKFGIEAPATNATPNYRTGYRGSSDASAGNSTFTTYTAPKTDLIVSQLDFGTPLFTQRINGSQVNTNATSVGAVNFANDVLYIGRRGGTTLPLNGLMYGLIVVGGAIPSTATIERVETILQAMNVEA